jgi:hypothetical protein
MSAQMRTIGYNCRHPTRNHKKITLVDAVLQKAGEAAGMLDQATEGEHLVVRRDFG